MRFRTAFAILVMFLFGLVSVVINHASAQTDERGLIARQGLVSGQKRIALVVGNSAYERAEAVLANAGADAATIAARLKHLGFQVISGIDQDYSAMRRTLKDFAKAMQGAEVGVFFYAGHGMEHEGNNYLFPTDATLETAGDIEFSLIGLNSILRVMEQAVPTRVILLDACRDNPFAKRFGEGSTRSSAFASVGGLAQIDANVGTYIAYSTAPGQVAKDGDLGHSPFALALLDALETPGLDLPVMMRNVRNSVMAMTDNQQVPWSTSSLRAALVLNQTIEDVQALEVGLEPFERFGIRQALFLLDYDMPLDDGPFGQRDRRRIQEFQRSIDARETGYLTGEQMLILVDKAHQWHVGAGRSDFPSLEELGDFYADDPDKSKLRTVATALIYDSYYKPFDDIEKDNQEAIRFYEELAVQGDSFAATNLGWIYLDADNIELDERLAEKWLTIGAEAGRVEAQNGLAKLYHRARQISRDLEMAVYWARQAAAQRAGISSFAASARLRSMARGR